MTLKRGSSVSRIDAHALDGAGRRALAAADLRAFERGTGRARAGQRGAGGCPARSPRWCRHRPATSCSSDRSGARREPCRPHRRRRGRRCRAGRRRARWDGSFSSISVARSVQRLVGRERKRRAAELDRIDAEQQVMHDRIADEGHLQDVLGEVPASRATSAASALSASRTASVICAAPPGFIIE